MTIKKPDQNEQYYPPVEAVLDAVLASCQEAVDAGKYRHPEDVLAATLSTVEAIYRFVGKLDWSWQQ